MSDALERLAMLEAEHEELEARIEAAERKRSDADAREEVRASLVKRLHDAHDEAATLRERADVLTRRYGPSAAKVLSVALLAGILLGFLMSIGHR